MFQSSEKLRDRSLLRCLVRQFDNALVRIAPAPTLRRVVTLDDWVLRLLKMHSRVSIWGVVAAADMAASPAQPQVYPPVTIGQTLLAANTGRSDRSDRVVVHARVSSHEKPPSLVSSRRRSWAFAQGHPARNVGPNGRTSLDKLPDARPSGRR